MQKTPLIALIAICCMAFTDKEIPFTPKNYQNFAFFFDSQQEMVTFFDFKKGNVVADIGAGKGTYEGVFSLFTDSITFYAEDIDTKTLNEKKLGKIMRSYAKIKGTPITNTVNICIGTEKTTNLPPNHFNKIILISSMHEFTYMDEMIKDIGSKLKPGGKVYILESYCYTKTHTNLTVDQIISQMNKQGFDLVKQQQPKAPLTNLFVFKKT